MTVSLFIEQFELPCFSSYIIKTMTNEIKFFPREKDRKPENINEPVETNDVENTKDVEKSKKNDNTWKKKNFNSEK